MADTKFTKGPHVVNPFKAQIEAVCDGPDAPICQMLWPTDLRSEEETLANAQLYAAAPEMFDLLEMLATASRKPTDNHQYATEAQDVVLRWNALRSKINGETA